MVFNASIRYADGRLMVDAVDVAAIIREVGTPAYIYSLPRVRDNFRRLKTAFAPLSAELHYSVKANGNLDILRSLMRVGAGFDCVSGGEIARVLHIGADPREIVFAGVGKTRAEVDYAVGRGVGWFNIENVAELDHIQSAADTHAIDSVRVALRLNPEVAAATHPHIATGHGAAKFGLTADVIESLLARQHDFPRLEFAGLHLHIGSQLGEFDTTTAALEKALALIQPHPSIRTVNIGGGFPVAYHFGETAPAYQDFAHALAPRLAGYEVLLEPGRSIVADAGILIAEVLYLKEQAGRLFYIVDASMTELMRPALYGAHHEIVPLREADGDTELAQVVGPVCESTDVLARDRELPRLNAGDHIAIMTAGAYGMVMANNYNARHLG